jgi:hypothetical protein
MHKPRAYVPRTALQMECAACAALLAVGNARSNVDQLGGHLTWHQRANVALVVSICAARISSMLLCWPYRTSHTRFCKHTQRTRLAHVLMCIHTSYTPFAPVQTMTAVSVEAAAALDTAGGVVVLSGCGTSGRVAFVVATAFNKLLVASGREPRVKYIMAGGDAALFTSREYVCTSCAFPRSIRQSTKYDPATLLPRCSPHGDCRAKPKL